MADIVVPERPFGAVKKTEEELSAVPLPRRQPSGVDTDLQVPQQQAPQQDTSYERDILANSPLASLPVDVQNNLTMAKTWYEIAMHPASTEFERSLAMAHLDDLGGPQPTDKTEEPDVTRGENR